MRTIASMLFALVGTTSAAVAGPVELASQMPARILAAHNQVRAEAGVAPLVWDSALGDVAANYAVYLAVTNSFQHSDQSHRPDTGENLWMGTRGAYSFEAMVGGWSSEQRDFVPGVFPAVSRAGSWEKVGHYTQMVWPTTTRVGCAIASNAANDYLVCRYSPAGNVMGKPLLTTAAAPSAPHAR
jgi:uncharacterized protein YkwD